MNYQQSAKRHEFVLVRAGVASGRASATTGTTDLALFWYFAFAVAVIVWRVKHPHDTLIARWAGQAERQYVP